MGGDSHHDEHEVKYELKKKLEGYYHPAKGSLVKRTFEKVRSMFFGIFIYI